MSGMSAMYEFVPETGGIRLMDCVNQYAINGTYESGGAGLAGTAEERFELYDDDYMSPTNGSMFGGPRGVFMNGTILPPNKDVFIVNPFMFRFSIYSSISVKKIQRLIQDFNVGPGYCYYLSVPHVDT